MTAITGLALVAALALAVGGAWLFTQPGGNSGPGRTKAILMIVAGIVVAFNAWVNSLPGPA